MRKFVLALAVALFLGASVAAADIQLGAIAPDFTKSVLGGGGATISLHQYSGKVVVLFLLGFT